MMAPMLEDSLRFLFKSKTQGLMMSKNESKKQKLGTESVGQESKNQLHKLRWKKKK